MSSPESRSCERKPLGHRCITGQDYERLKAENRHILKSEIDGHPSTVLFLEVPFRLGSWDEDTRLLHRITLGELPGWRRLHVTPGSTVILLPRLSEYSVAKCKYLRCKEPGQEGLEITLQCDGHEHRVWMVGCPESLLQCVIATLKQSGVVGLKFYDLGDLRLVGTD